MFITIFILLIYNNLIIKNNKQNSIIYVNNIKLKYLLTQSTAIIIILIYLY